MKKETSSRHLSNWWFVGAFTICMFLFVGSIYSARLENSNHKQETASEMSGHRSGSIGSSTIKVYK